MQKIIMISETETINEHLEDGWVVNTDFNNPYHILIEKKSSVKSEPEPYQNTDVNDVYNYFLQECKALYTRKPELTKSRVSSIKSRLREFGREKVMTMVKEAGASEFLAGQNNREWKASIDWIFKPTNFVKVLEQKYRSGDNNQKAFKLD